MSKAGLFWGVALLYSLLHFGYSIMVYNPFTHPVSVDDVRVTFLEAQNWRQTGNLVLMGGTNVFYGLLYYLFLSLFSAFRFEQLVLPFYLSQVVLFPLAIFWLVRALVGKKAGWKEFLFVTVLTLNFQPFLESFASCKVECLEFYLICLVFYGFLKGWDWLAGAGVVAGTMMKYLPGFLGGYFLLKREWRTVRWCLGWTVGIFGMLWLVFGNPTFWEIGIRHFLSLIFGSKVETNELVALLEWQTLSGTINRLFAQFDATHTLKGVLKSAGLVWVHHPDRVIALALALKGVLVGIYLAVIRRRWPPRERRAHNWLYALEMSLTLLMTVMVVQAVRLHHAVILLPAFLTVGLLLLQHPNLFGRIEKMLFLVSYALSAVLIPGGVLNLLPASPIWGKNHARMYYWMSFPFYGYLFLFFCVILCHRRLRARPEVSS